MRLPYQLKDSFLDQARAIAAEETSDSGASMEVIAGYYGERGVAFYPYQSSRDPEAKAGFSLIGRGVNNQHTTLGKNDARTLANFLVDTYGFEAKTKMEVRYVTVVE